MSKESKKDGTTIRPCSCVHAYQNLVHGKGMRVHNCGKKGESCTVCRAVK